MKKSNSHRNWHEGAATFSREKVVPGKCKKFRSSWSSSSLLSPSSSSSSSPSSSSTSGCTSEFSVSDGGTTIHDSHWQRHCFYDALINNLRAYIISPQLHSKFWLLTVKYGMSAGLSAVGTIGWAVDGRIFTLMSSLASLTSRERKRLADVTQNCVFCFRKLSYQFSKTLVRTLIDNFS